jgi:hypothetical protein
MHERRHPRRSTIRESSDGFAVQAAVPLPPPIIFPSYNFEIDLAPRSRARQTISLYEVECTNEGIRVLPSESIRQEIVLISVQSRTKIRYNVALEYVESDH